MSNLFSALGASSGTLTAFTRSLNVIQNNISNASTAGYAAQQVNLQALSFQPDTGVSGGVTAGVQFDSRNVYADQSVRNQITSLGLAQQQYSSLTSLQAGFDITGQSGIPKALNQLFTSFSALSLTPNSQTARQSVLQAAAAAAQGFQDAASNLNVAFQDADRQLGGTVTQINTITQQIAAYNQQRHQAGGPDPGLDARIASSLENLAELANFTSSVAPDGSVNILLGGQTPLVLGTQQFGLQTGVATATSTAAYPGGALAAEVQDQTGKDVSSQVTGGKLGAILQFRNVSIAAIRGDQSQLGTLNQLAQSFADRVNSILTSAQVTSGPPAQPGVPLFSYDPTQPARTLAVNTAITPQLLATIDPGPPASANGAALALAGLAQPNSAADEINGVSFTGFYGQIAAQIGSQLSAARDSKDSRTQSVAQVRSLRDQVSGVSLDAEAVHLLEYQKAYGATAKLISILDQITQTTLDILK